MLGGVDVLGLLIDSVSKFAEFFEPAFKVAGLDVLYYFEHFPDVGARVAGETECAEELKVKCLVGTQSKHVGNRGMRRLF